MSVTRVLILGHSFIRRLREYIGRNADLDANLHILESIELKWHGVGGRTVLKTVQFDLSVVERFMPDIVILQLGTNDLSHLPAVNVGSAIEDLTRSLHDLLNVKCVCVCQTVTRLRIVRLHLELWARLFRPTFAEQWKSCRFNVLPQSSVIDHIKHATCVAKFIQLMCLDLLRILQQTSATASRVSVP